MEQARHRSLAREAEEIVGRLRGVSAVRVDLGDDGTDRTAARARVGRADAPGDRRRRRRGPGL